MKPIIALCSFLTVAIGCGPMAGSGPRARLTDGAPAQGSLAESRTVSASDSAYHDLLKLVDGLSPETLKAVDTPMPQRVAGQKAMLVAVGMEFEPAVRKLTDSHPWQLPAAAGIGSEDQSGGEISDLGKVKIAAKLLYAYAETVEEGGNPELGARALLTCRQLGMRVMEDSRSLIVSFVGIAVDAIADKGIRTAILRGNWGAGEIKSVQGQGAGRFSAAVSLGKSLESEFENSVLPIIGRSTFPVRDREKQPWLQGTDEEVLSFMEQNPHPFDQAQTAEMARKYVQLSIGELQTNPLDGRASAKFWEEAVGDVPTEEADERAMLTWCKTKPNAFGRYLLSVTMPAIGQARQAAIRNEAIRGLTEVAMAARRGWAETGKLPATYGDLKAFGLPSDVSDPYTGKAYQYDPDRGIAWSTGPDGQDDGGQDPPESHRDDAKDWVVRVK
ncbi:MAG: hypothetical protein JNM28_04125 [Armatimonadetes bacterium]|nr:hypothetical protein [Armatimonadota bacterium]